MYKIKLGDGNVLGELRLNGNNFISVYPVSEETFAGHLSNVEITCDSEEDMRGADAGLLGKHAHMELVRIAHEGGPLGGEWWFILREISPEELRQAGLRGDVDYIAMMTGVEL